MRTSFSSLAIGEKFHTGKFNGSGIMSDKTMWQEFEKISKSQAVCVGQFGYGNTRQVGSKQSFAGNKPVWKV